MKTIMTLSSAIVLSLTMGTAVVAANATADYENRGNHLLEQFDIDQDGSITGDEVQFVLNERFTTADANNDGFLTADEISAAHKQRHQERAAEHFAKLDTDGNGSLSLEELQAGKPPMSPFGGKHRGGLGGPEQMFSRRDQDKDGLLSSTEVSTPILNRLVRLDTNQDGVISPEELNQTPSSFGHRGDGKHRGDGRYHGRPNYSNR